MGSGHLIPWLRHLTFPVVALRWKYVDPFPVGALARFALLSRKGRLVLIDFRCAAYSAHKANCTCHPRNIGVGWKVRREVQMTCRVVQILQQSYYISLEFIGCGCRHPLISAICKDVELNIVAELINLDTLAAACVNTGFWEFIGFFICRIGRSCTFIRCAAASRCGHQHSWNKRKEPASSAQIRMEAEDLGPNGRLWAYPFR